MGKKSFFSGHSKASALVVSLMVHAVLVFSALFFVAVTVIQKDEVGFEAKEIKRPNMNLRKLQVPVNLKKPPQQPKLRKQIVAKPNVANMTPDIKMPEIVGVKGGMGAAGGGLGDAVSLGFSMPEINLFGVRSKGEKIFIILDSSPEIMGDEMGGIPAYTIIKEELVRVLGGLPQTALFNVAVYESHRAKTRFPQMVSASAHNVELVEQWLEPLNAVREGMGDKDYGIDTLPKKAGVKIEKQAQAGKIERVGEWYRPAQLAMMQQADTVFLLTCFWGYQWQSIGEIDDREWKQSSAGRRWKECYEEGKRKLAEENRQRAAEGRPPRVLADSAWTINGFYFPNIEKPPVAPKYYYTASDFNEAFLEIHNRNSPVEMQAKLGVRRKTNASKGDFSFNVIHFRATGDAFNTQRHTMTEQKFKQLVNRCNGEYRTLAGFEAIKSSVSLSSL